MRYYLCLIFLFFFWNTKAESYALLIGISEYPAQSGWATLSSKNDIIHLEAALKLNGFKTANINKIEDDLATKSEILNQFQKLIDSVNKGDIVYVHFSGHGQQVIDDNNDEVDALDESIVPYDSPKEYKKNVNEGERLIRDDKLEIFCSALRKKLGTIGQLILVLDSCNSGTGIRGQYKTMTRVRGTSVVMAPDSKLLRIKKRKLDRDKGIKSEYNKRGLAPMAIYYSTQAHELNYETYDAQLQPIGSLSFAMATILSEVKKELTFKELYDRIVQRMHILSPKQHPQWEGNPNQVVFQNNLKDLPSEYYSISNYFDNNMVEIETGTLAGHFEGSQVGLICLENQRIINYGSITKASLTNSLITLDENFILNANNLYKVKILKKSLNSYDLTVRIDNRYGNKWSEIINNIQAQEYIEISECNADLYLESNSNSLVLKDIEGNTLVKCESLSCRNELEKKLFEYAQVKFLKNCESKNEDHFFSINLFRADCDKINQKINDLDTLNNLSVHVGECVQLLIKNEGSSAAYFSLLDIQPDNQLNILLPNKYSNKSTQDFYLQPGKTYLTDFIIEVAEPLGKETLKLISSSKPISFSTFLNRSNANTRGRKSAFSLAQLVFPQHSDNQSSLNRSSQGASEKVGITTFVFEIVK